jgi:hypothetical protein
MKKNIIKNKKVSWNRKKKCKKIKYSENIPQ